MVNAELDRIIQNINGNNTDISEWEIPLTADTNIFIGKKPTEVLFGEERVKVHTWKKAFEIILKRCNANPECHNNLMYLRDLILKSASFDYSNIKLNIKNNATK